MLNPRNPTGLREILNCINCYSKKNMRTNLGKFLYGNRKQNGNQNILGSNQKLIQCFAMKRGILDNSIIVLVTSIF